MDELWRAYEEDNEERLERIVSLSMVDGVVLLDPKPGTNLEDYYRRVWRTIKPDIYFFEDENYRRRPVLENRAREMGVLLMWARSKNKISTSEMILQLCR